jgi:hypothetical protein
MKKLVLLALGLVWVFGCGNNATDPMDLSMNSEASFTAVNQNVTAVKSDMLNEWIDSWTANGKVSPWYTPEKYTFVTGDTVETIVFYDPEGWNLVRVDGFYIAGEKNPLNYQMSNSSDFGKLPPLPANYGWITGVGYIAPKIKGSFDWASQCITSAGKLTCGVPLSGRPNTFKIN